MFIFVAALLATDWPALYISLLVRPSVSLFCCYLLMAYYFADVAMHNCQQFCSVLLLMPH